MKKQLLLLLSFVVSGMFAPVYLYAGEKKGNAPHYGISVAVKTNLYSLTGFTPDFEYATVMPNLEAELFFSDRWSISVSGLYSHFEGCYGTGRFWGVSAYTLQPRFWFYGDGLFQGPFAGVYGRIGDFDFRRRYNGDLKRSTDNKTGHYWETGISAGWSFAFCQNWLLELSASCGYLHATVMPYEPNPAGEFYQTARYGKSRFDLTGISISLGYRFKVK